MTLETIRAGRLALYGAMGLGTVTFGSTAANADICFTDLTGNEMVFTSTSPVSIDMDGDGNDDFTFAVETIGPNTYSTNSWVARIAAATGAPAVNGIVEAANADPSPAARLAASYSISGQAFSNFGYLQKAFTSYNPSEVYGYWNGGGNSNGFAGVRFQDGTGATRFGWIELSYSGSVADGDFADVAVTVSGYAFAKDETIVVGQTVGTVNAIPEPTAIGLLALGGVGVMTRRRRKAKSSTLNQT